MQCIGLNQQYLRFNVFFFARSLARLLPWRCWQRSNERKKNIFTIQEDVHVCGDGEFRGIALNWNTNTGCTHEMMRLRDCDTNEANCAIYTDNGWVCIADDFFFLSPFCSRFFFHLLCHCCCNCHCNWERCVVVWLCRRRLQRWQRRCSPFDQIVVFRPVACAITVFNDSCVNWEKQKRIYGQRVQININYLRVVLCVHCAWWTSSFRTNERTNMIGLLFAIVVRHYKTVGDCITECANDDRQYGSRAVHGDGDSVLWTLIEQTFSNDWHCDCAHHFMCAARRDVMMSDEMKMRFFIQLIVLFFRCFRFGCKKKKKMRIICVRECFVCKIQFIVTELLSSWPLLL